MSPLRAALGAAALGALTLVAVSALPQSVSGVSRIAAAVPGTAVPVDARVPITVLPFTIDECGSYVLTGCLTGVAGRNGITIEADDVTLDLDGFTLLGVPGSLDGVHVDGTRSSVTVRNGSVRGWGFDGVDLAGASGSSVLDLHAADNTTDATAMQNDAGIKIGTGSLVLRCTSESHARGSGVIAGEGSTVRDCTASSNAGFGILSMQRGTVADCTARGNGNQGISVGTAGTAIGCTATGNLTGIGSSPSGMIVDCHVEGNTGVGIRTTQESTVRGCTSTQNSIGIQVTFGCLVVDNHCSGNGTGIRIPGTGFTRNRVEGNLVTNNSTFGIEVASPECIVVRNTATANGTDYSIVAGNAVGQIQTVSGGVVITTSNSWANFRY